MRASAIRALFAVANRPEVVSLAGGMPYLQSLPLESLAAEAAATGHRGRPGRAAVRLRPGHPAAARADLPGDGARGHQGAPRRRDGHRRLADGARPGHPDLLRPGRRHPRRGARPTSGRSAPSSAYQAQVVHVAMDDDGLIPEALEAAIEACRAAGRRVKLLYTIPNFHNPAGVTLSDDRRGVDRRDLPARRHRDPRGQPLRTPGFRRQAAPGDPRRRRRQRDLPRLVLQDVRPGPAGRLGARAARGAGEAGAGQRGRDAEPAGLQPDADLPVPGEVRLAEPDQGLPADLRRAAGRDARPRWRTHMPEGTTWTHPDGGFYVWVTLPEGFDAAAMLPRAVTARVAYVPGTAFYADGLGARQLRLSYCFPTSERIAGGRAAAGRRCWRASSTSCGPSAPPGRGRRSGRRRRRRTPPDAAADPVTAHRADHRDDRPARRVSR